MSLPVTAAPYLAATILLGAAGVAKTAPAGRHRQCPARAPASPPAGSRSRSESARPARWRWPWRPWSFPGPLTGALVAAAYAGFAVFVLVALRRGWALSSCGCFGRPDTPPTPAHAVLNAGAAVSAAWWAAAWGSGATASSGWGSSFSTQPWHGAPLALLVVVLSGLAYLVWTDPLPAARR